MVAGEHTPGPSGDFKDVEFDTFKPDYFNSAGFDVIGTYLLAFVRSARLFVA